jgi:hypothetical protein
VKGFLKTTIVGGLLFLLPLGLVLFVLAYALRLATGVAQPISKALHLDQLGDVAGVGFTKVLVSFAAGIVARRSIGGRISSWFESSVLSTSKRTGSGRWASQWFRQWDYHNIAVTQWLNVTADLQIINPGLKKAINEFGQLAHLDIAAVGGACLRVRF